MPHQMCRHQKRSKTRRYTFTKIDYLGIGRCLQKLSRSWANDARYEVQQPRAVNIILLSDNPADTQVMIYQLNEASLLVVFEMN